MNRIFSNQKGGTLLCYVPDDKAAPGIGAICALLKGARRWMSELARW